MAHEPKSELARYAFGYSDKKPGLLSWLILAAMFAFVLWAMLSPAFACHRFSVWKYPYPQRCSVTTHVAIETPPLPPKNPCIAYPEMCFAKDIDPTQDIPLPSLEHMEFPPDCVADWCERLKGVGLLRDKFGTN